MLKGSGTGSFPWVISKVLSFYASIYIYTFNYTRHLIYLFLPLYSLAPKRGVRSSCSLWIRLCILGDDHLILRGIWNFLEINILSKNKINILSRNETKRNKALWNTKTNDLIINEKYIKMSLVNIRAKEVLFRITQFLRK